jgi:hypothetical protein
MVESYSKDNSVNIAVIDGYRNSRMVTKLGIDEMPVLVELNKGTVAKSTKPVSAADIAAFLG